MDSGLMPPGAPLRQFERQIVLDQLEQVERGGVVCAVCFLIGPGLLLLGSVILALGIDTVLNWRLTLTLAAALAVALLVLAFGFFILLVGLKGRAVLRVRRRRLRRQLAELRRPVEPPVVGLGAWTAPMH